MTHHWNALKLRIGAILAECWCDVNKREARFGTTLLIDNQSPRQYSRVQNRIYTMEYQKAIDILKSLLDKHPLNAQEKEAVTTAIGVLSWGALAKSKIKSQKARRDKNTKW